MAPLHLFFNVSLKAVLHKKGNENPCIPISHSPHPKETYDNMDVLLNAIQFNIYRWNIRRDRKVMGMLMGMHAGLTKYCRFICLWDSRATKKHFTKRDMSLRSTCVPGINSIQYVSLVDPLEIFVPPLHIILGLMKNFVKAMGKMSARGFQYLFEKFPKVSEAKLKE